MNDVQRINKLLSPPFLQSVISVNVSSGVHLAGRWLPLASDILDDQLLYRLDLGFKRPVILSETISIIITQTAYEQVRPKLVSLQRTLPHLFTSDLP